MTDFLTDLLERSRGQGTALVPRIPSVFEPAPDGTLRFAREDIIQPGAEHTARPAAPDTARLATQAPAVTPERMPAPRWPQPSPQATARPEGQLPAPSRTAPAAPARIPARAEGGETGRQPAGEPAIPQARAAVPPAAETTRELLAKVAVPPPETADHRPRAARPATALSRGGDEGVPPPEIKPETTERPGPGALPPPPARVGETLSPPRPGLLTVPPLDAFAAPPVPPGPAGDPAPPPEPTVHVTIGRVEIRAVTAPVPSARPASAARAMSLDEYLTERNQRRQA